MRFALCDPHARWHSIKREGFLLIRWKAMRQAGPQVHSETTFPSPPVIVPSYDLAVVRRGLDWRAGHKGLDQWDMLAEVLKAFPPPSRPPKKMAATP